MGQLTQTSPETPPPTAQNPIPAPTAESISTAASAPARVLGLNRGDRRVVTVLIAVAFVLMSLHWYRLTQHRPAPIVVLHPKGHLYQLDVNRASWVEWMQLDRVGETLARRIVEDRERRGPFTSIDDVQRVNGIGPKTLESLRPHLTWSDPSDGATE